MNPRRRCLTQRACRSTKKTAWMLRQPARGLNHLGLASGRYARCRGQHGPTAKAR